MPFNKFFFENEFVSCFILTCSFTLKKEFNSTKIIKLHLA